MNKSETTKFLSDLLIRDWLPEIGKYYVRQVIIDPWTDHGRKVDFMQFIPDNQISVSGIEKGNFVCYEVKSCKEDIYSGEGLTFVGDMNYIVTTMECYKSILDDYRDGTLGRFIKDKDSEASNHFGILVPVPDERRLPEEFYDPTPLDSNMDRWKLREVMPCHPAYRKRSMTELLFYMLRSCKLSRN